MSSKPGQRLAPFLDVLGALLIFGSWFASNALSQRAQSEAGTHQGMIDRIRHSRLYEDFAGRTRDIQVELDRTTELVRIAIQDSRSSDSRETDPLPDPPRWSGMTATQIRQLTDLVDDLEGYARQLSESPGAMSSIAAIRERVEELSRGFRSAREEYDRTVAPIGSSGARSSGNAAAREALQARVDALWKSYESAKEALLEFGDERLERAAARTASASLRAKRGKQVSYVFYVVGTLMIMYGRARSALAAKQKSPA